jgi:purine-nucleoside phosphorylase
MLYIVTALKPEAQAFIDKYKLQKESLKSYKIFTNKNIKLIISGLGVKNSMLATQTLINNFDITDEDIYLNIGICGASTKHKIGELLNISTIEYKKKKYQLKENILKTITCLDKEVSTDKYEIVDMESFGFFNALIHSPAIKHRYILKVVSDHFEPHKVTKDKTKSLIFNVIDDINLLLFK